ncbi:RecA protein, putative [Ixodes scapularis]|uniref:RecA protein, putative n=1 Tax=Ixodes scapularis TaxID=6945 RepID=B7Q2Y2_IXOSC|nr:RecA protein, putative [Ixodes scapularis]|eukprot:XP_002411080.1 RecA protein, putative [Ixodes scapularis]
MLCSGDEPVPLRRLHREVRPDHRGLLPQGDRGGPGPLRARDPRHGRHGAVRLHAGPVHQERPGLRGGLLHHEPPHLPGHQEHEGADPARQERRPGARAPGGQQVRPGPPARGDGRRDGGPGPALGLPLHGGLGQKQVQRERDVRRDRPRNERSAAQGKVQLPLLRATLAAFASALFAGPWSAEFFRDQGKFPQGS